MGPSRPSDDATRSRTNVVETLVVRLRMQEHRLAELISCPGESLQLGKWYCRETAKSREECDV